MLFALISMATFLYLFTVAVVVVVVGWWEWNQYEHFWLLLDLSFCLSLRSFCTPLLLRFISGSRQASKYTNSCRGREIRKSTRNCSYLAHVNWYRNSMIAACSSPAKRVNEKKKKKEKIKPIELLDFSSLFILCTHYADKNERKLKTQWDSHGQRKFRFKIFFLFINTGVYAKIGD